MVMRYTMEFSTIPLKWEWHLKVIPNGKLFDIIFSDSIATMTGLRDLLSLTTELLKAKDKELAQYRAEGFALRRATVVTKPFQYDAFKEQHKTLLGDADAYQLIAEDFQVAVPSVSAQMGLTSPRSSSTSGSSAAPGSSSSSGSSTKLTPRNRKRKAQESNVVYMERRVIERRSNSKHTFKSSQSSQEESIDDYFEVNEGRPQKPQDFDAPLTSALLKSEEDVKPEPSCSVKMEPSTSETETDEESHMTDVHGNSVPANPAKEEPSSVADNEHDELEELKALLDETKKIIDKHSIDK
ncbi:hypothetical protein KR067_005262 [Drosophila pandora]|nr:hypothetical protein KR067_005262 [Drosophila pandora]